MVKTENTLYSYDFPNLCVCLKRAVGKRGIRINVVLAYLKIHFEVWRWCGSKNCRKSRAAVGLVSIIFSRQFVCSGPSVSAKFVLMMFTNYSH